MPKDRTASHLRNTYLADLVNGFTYLDGAGLGPIKVQKVTYDFAVDGGTAATITPAQTPIPQGALVLGGVMRVIAAITGGATLAVQLVTANDIINAAADSGAPWSTTGKKAIIPKFNTPESTSIGPLVAPGYVSFVRSVANITAGKVEVYLLYCASSAL